MITAVAGWFVPAIARSLNAKRQRKYLLIYMEKIDNTHCPVYENKEEYLNSLDSIRSEIEKIYAIGRISDSHYQMLNNKVLKKIEEVKSS